MGNPQLRGTTRLIQGVTASTLLAAALATTLAMIGAIPAGADGRAGVDRIGPMVRYVQVVSEDPDLFENVRRTLLRDSRFIDGTDLVHCDGTTAPLTNIYSVETTPAEWEDWAPRQQEYETLPARVVSTMLFECRSAPWIAEVSKLIAEGLDAPVWIVDAVDNVWPADRVEPERVDLG